MELKAKNQLELIDMEKASDAVQEVYEMYTNLGEAGDMVIKSELVEGTLTMSRGLYWTLKDAVKIINKTTIQRNIFMGATVGILGYHIYDKFVKKKKHKE